MSVRFVNDGESYTRSTGLAAVTVFSFACWVKLAADRATATVPLQIDNGSGTGRMRINAFNGTQLTFQSDGTTWFGNFGLTMTVGTWTYVALSATSNPGQVRTAARAAGSNTFASGTTTQANITMNAATLRIGDGQAASEWLNGSIAAVKVWDQALTAAELQQESWTYQPKRSAGLRGWYPLLIPETTDYSGRAQTLSGGTGAAVDGDGPPIIWGAVRRRIHISATAPTVTGALAATLPALTGTASGTVKASGTLAATLPPLAAAAAATAKVAGTAAATLPPLAAALVGGVDSSSLNAVLPPLTGSLAGQVKASGTAAGVLPALTAAISGNVEIPVNDITVTSTGPVRGWNAGRPDTSWDANQLARTWNARPPERAVAAERAARGWNTRPPTG